MIIKLAAGTVRRRKAAFAGTFLTAFLAVALIAGSGLLLFSVLTAGPGADRFAAADAVVAGDRAVVLTTEQAKGDGEVKVKTKSERLTGAPALPDELVDTVAGTPGVATAVPDAAFPVAVDVGGVPVQAPDRAAVVAHGWASAALTPYELTQGAPPGPGGVVLDAALADGLRIGETVRVTTRTGVRDLRLVGVAAPATAGGVPGQAAVFVSDVQVGELSGLAGPTAVGVRMAPGADAAAVVAGLRQRIGDSAAVHTGADKVTADLPGAVPDYIGAISIFGFVLGITGFAAVFVLTGTVSLAVRQRLRELALLRTAGATPRQLSRMLGLENNGRWPQSASTTRGWPPSTGPTRCGSRVSHGDVIKAVLADALGMHLDSFQRIVVDPCSVSVVRYTPLRPFVAAGQRRRRPDRSTAVRRRRRAGDDAPLDAGDRPASRPPRWSAARRSRRAAAPAPP